jgi:hypothetical protein
MTKIIDLATYPAASERDGSGETEPALLVPVTEEPTPEEMDAEDVDDELTFAALIEEMRQLAEPDTILEVPSVDDVLESFTQLSGDNDDC